MAEHEDDGLDRMIGHLAKAAERARPAEATGRPSEELMQRLRALESQKLAAASGAQVISLADRLAERRAERYAVVPGWDEEAEEVYLATGAGGDQIELTSMGADSVGAGIERGEYLGEILVQVRPEFDGDAYAALVVRWECSEYHAAGWRLEVGGLVEGAQGKELVEGQVELGSERQGEWSFEEEQLGFSPTRLVYFKFVVQ